MENQYYNILTKKENKLNLSESELYNELYLICISQFESKTINKNLISKNFKNNKIKVFKNIDSNLIENDILIDDLLIQKNIY